MQAICTYGLANQKLFYFQMHLNIEKSGEQDQECSKEWLVDTNPRLDTSFAKLHNLNRQS